MNHEVQFIFSVILKIDCETIAPRKKVKYGFRMACIMST